MDPKSDPNGARINPFGVRGRVEKRNPNRDRIWDVLGPIRGPIWGPIWGPDRGQDGAKHDQKFDPKNVTEKEALMKKFSWSSVWSAATGVPRRDARAPHCFKVKKEE